MDQGERQCPGNKQLKSWVEGVGGNTQRRRPTAVSTASRYALLPWPSHSHI